MTSPDPQKTDEALGALIRLHRKTAGLSQEDLGNAVGTSAQQIQKYEVGHNRVSVHRLLSIAQALGIKAVTILEEVECALGHGQAAHSNSRTRELEFLGSSTGRLLISSLMEMNDENFGASLAHVAKAASRTRQD